MGPRGGRSAPVSFLWARGFQVCLKDSPSQHETLSPGGATTQWGRRARQLWGEGSEGLPVQATWLSPPSLGTLGLGATRAGGRGRLRACVAGRVGCGPGGQGTEGAGSEPLVIC